MSSAVVLRQCPHCDKSFINSSFLQNHLQRRHPDEFEMQQSRSDSEKKSQLDVLKAEISSLKEELGQQTLLAKAAQEKEQETLHRDLVRELDRFKAEEMARTDRKIEDSRDGIRREMEFLYTRNFQARIKQDKKWESRMQDIKNQHESEKNQLLSELSRMQLAGEQQSRDKEPVLPPSGHQDSRGASDLLSACPRTKTQAGCACSWNPYRRCRRRTE
ncbi:hypothetical protein NHX12_017078, partial [Muraenolepis orangiensis]